MDDFDLISGLVGGVLFAVIVIGTLNSIFGNTRDIVFEECATGQNLTLRETFGTASFEVTFQDGEFASFTCTSNPSPASN